MALLRFIVVLISCLSFASASFAAVQMQCCAEKAAPAKMQMAKPCHDSQPAKPAQHKPATMKGCNCVCSLQNVALPDTVAAAAVAVDAEQAMLHPLAYTSPSYIIYSPPRRIS